MKQKDGMIVALLGVIAGLLIVLVFQLQSTPNAVGQTAAAKADKWAMATSVSTNAAVCFLFDAESMRLGAYTVMSGGNQFELVGVRQVTSEFSVQQFGKGVRPTVKQIKDEIDKEGGGKGGGKK